MPYHTSAVSDGQVSAPKPSMYGRSRGSVFPLEYASPPGVVPPYPVSPVAPVPTCSRLKRPATPPYVCWRCHSKEGVGKGSTGYQPLNWLAYIVIDRPICRQLERHLVTRAAARALP